MHWPSISRRNFVRLGVYSLPAFCLADGLLLEPGWIAAREVVVGADPTRTLVHFTDLHYKGDQAHLAKIVAMINRLAPDFACFTGDIVEDAAFLDEALALLAGIACPLYGVPGNHDYWSRAPFADIAKTFEATGGRWLVDQAATALGGAVDIIGVSGDSDSLPAAARAGERRLLLTHYPAFVDGLGDERFELILAGHSHGGQVRLPFAGSLIVPDGTGQYDLGLYNTASGPLYVSSGVGWWLLPVRFMCRPEIALIRF